MIAVDRIEGEIAVLDVQGVMVDVPLAVLPEGLSEGAQLKLVLCEKDSSTLTQENEDRLRRLRGLDPGDMEIEL